MLGQQSITAKARRRRTEGNASPELQVSRLGDDQEDGEVAESNGNAGPSKKNVDDLLPIGVSLAVSCRPLADTQRLPAPPAPRKQLKASSRKEWAHVVDVNKELTNVCQLNRSFPES